MARRARYRHLVMGLAAAVLLGAAACGGDGDGDGRALPSGRPSVEVSLDRTTRGTPEQTRTEQTEDPEPTRTQETEPEPTRTQDPEPEPTRTQEAEPEPTRTQETEPEPTRTQETEPEPTRTQDPDSTEEPAEQPAASAAAVPVSDDADSGGFLGWLLLFVLLGSVIAIVLVSRSRRVAVWEAEASALAAETRSVTGVRLPPVLTARTAAERSLSWPPARDDLIDLSARWGTLATRSIGDAQQAHAGTVAALLRDLVPAIDAENEALAGGREWHRLRPQVDSVLESLNAILTPQPAPGTVPPADPGPAPYPA
ncbi:hypothetical protein [Actinoplanes aureus]|uniref:Uncharacterized protein n=1 Tax=Actinoplanes aureus TaxID=2792083 RepID=A0A931CJ85_9ACTN|nr:hypothetical protein [Actinoplanes aureus]MBG0567183.1 hypothetical protein [Actinoplanes aureus]